MNKFEERERDFETEFAHEQELSFKIASYRNRLLGRWAARHLGLSGADAERYAQDVVDADLTKPGHAAVIDKVALDFASQGLPISAAQISDEFHRLTAEARKQVMAQ